jgi:hypothetical protein
LEKYIVSYIKSERIEKALAPSSERVMVPRFERLDVPAHSGYRVFVGAPELPVLARKRRSEALEPAADNQPCLGAVP